MNFKRAPRSLFKSSLAGMLMACFVAGSAATAQAQNGTVSGRITRASDNSNISGVSVSIVNSAGLTVVFAAASAADGTYTANAVPPGTYYARTSNSLGFINEVFNDVQCLQCNVTLGTPITVAAGQIVTGIDFALTAGGRITGTVRNASTNAPVNNVAISITNPSGTQVSSGNTGTSGSGVYTSGAGLPAGTYFVRTQSNNSGLVNALYNGAGGSPCFNCIPSTGTPVVITGTNNTTGIDFALAPGATITGTIKDTAGAAITNASVTAFDPTTGTFLNQSASTASDGVYTIGGLPAGGIVLKTSHFVSTDGSTIPATMIGYPDRLYPNTLCLNCDVRGGTPVAVTAGGVTSGINFSLAAGGRIAGKITNASTGAIVSGVSLQIFNNVGNSVGNGFTNTSGNYFSPGLPAGSYFVRTTFNSAGLINQLYDNINCLSCSVVSGTAVVVQEGPVAVANFALPVGGQITGTIRNATSPLQNVFAQLYNSSGTFITSTNTNSAGVFTLAGLQAGSYFVRTSNGQGFIDQVYALNASNVQANQTCLNCSVSTVGSPIAVTIGTPVTGIDFNLSTGGSITGTVKDESNANIQNVSVQVLSSTGSQISSVTTTSAGTFSLGGLPTGNYYIRTSNPFGVTLPFIPVVYNGGTGVTCLNCNVTTTGTAIPVTAGATVSNINLVLALGKTITGTVTNKTSSAAIQGVTVNIYSESGTQVAFPQTNVSGAFSTAGLPAGIYYAKTSNSQGFVDQLFNDKVCPSCANTSGNPIDLSAFGTTTASANFALSPGARISGTITDAATGQPLGSTNVSFYSTSGTFVASGFTNDTGRYTTSGGLPTGTYFAQASVSGYVNQLYSGIQCNSSCSVVSGTAIAVTAGTPKTGIDFAMRLGGRVTGRITDTASTSSPAAGVEAINVSIYDAITGSFMRSGTSTATGSYSVVGLPAGTYTARTSNSAGYIDELYDDLRCATCSVTAGKPFVVTAGATTTDINFGLGRGGRITGTVTAAVGGAVLQSVNVSVYNSQNQFVTSASSNQNGVYTTSGMAAGTYFVRTTFNSGGFINQLWESLVCVSCNASTGKPVVVSGTNTTSGINFALAAGGSVTGRVTDAANANTTTNGVPSVSVSLYDRSNVFVGSGNTSSSGTYSVSGVPTGTYFARTTSNSLGFINQLYSGIACASCSVTGGTPFTVAAGAATTGINFALTQGGAISGTVTDAASAPLGAVAVQVYAANGQFVTSTSTGANGTYRTAGLPAANYFVKTSNSLGFVDELYNDTTCLGCSPITGAPVAVTAGATKTGIDFSLLSGGLITGTVTARGTSTPLESISVNVYTPAGLFVTSGFTNSSGTYRTGGMPAGNYFVRTSNSRGLIDQLYNGKDCTFCNPTTGTSVSVATGAATSGIDLSLATGGRIRGTVTTNTVPPVPAPGVSVSFFTASGVSVGSGFTDSQGNYVTYGGLPTGTYYSRTSNTSGYIDEMYDDLACASCSPTTGKPITVTAGADTTGINYALGTGGRISGTVTDTASTPQPIANARVSIYSSSGVFMTSTTTGNSGKYLTGGGLAAGNYFIRVSAPGGLITALYKVQTSPPNNINCPACSPLTGSPVPVTADATTANIDFALNAGGLITGTVSDLATGVPLSGINVSIFDQTNGFIAGALTDASGRYSSGSGVPSGTYFARTSNSQGYVNRVYNNTNCVSCLPNSGAPISVTSGNTTSGVDFLLALGGRVSGTVTDVVTGLPVSGASVVIFGSDGKGITGTTTNNAGGYVTSGGLPTGSYFARVSAGDLGYVTQMFENTTCVSCDPTRGKAIAVTGGSTTSAINFALVVGGGVSGRVTSNDATAPNNGVGNAEVLLFTGQGTFVAKTVTNAEGNFGGSGIPPGNYLVRTRNLKGFVDEAFDNKACSPCPMNSTFATPITVTAKSTTSGINFGLDTGGLVTGIVTNSTTGAPLEGVTVSFLQNGVFKGRSLPTDDQGYYAISLPVGTYTVVPDAVQGYATPTSSRAGAAAATTVTVTKGTEVPSVSFPLTTCTPPTVSPSTLSIFTAGHPYSRTLTATGGTGPYTFSVSSGSLPPGLSLNAATGVISGTPTVSGTASFSVAAADSLGCAGTADYTPFVCGVAVNASEASFTSVAAGASLALAANSTDCTWTATSNAPWLTLSGASGTGSGSLTYAVAANTSPAIRTGTMTVAGNTVTVTQAGAVTAPPFGSFDTPSGVGTVSGSIPVTGWALDDIGVTKVEIWRDRVPGETTPVFTGGGPGNGKIYIADPLFVSGARSDVAAAYASYPFANRAGWGYLMLTQGLFNQGNGTFTFYAFAYDQEGKVTTLGTKTITIDNANATKPFGSIDTPTYGETKSGSFWNFGWALTPGTGCLITNGNVSMAIDSQPLTPVSYGDPRPDIAGIFPGFTNGAGAGGAIFIDTTTLSDGAHQIGWYVVDNCNRAEGVGSRFFTVANGTSGAVTGGPATIIEAGLTAPAEGVTASRAAETLLAGVVTVQTDGEASTPVESAADGWHVIQVRQGSRIVVQLPTDGGLTYTAYQIANGERTPLPLGSSFDAAGSRFYWEPAPGYLGSYDLVFVAADGAAVPVRVVVVER